MLNKPIVHLYLENVKNFIDVQLLYYFGDGKEHIDREMVLMSAVKSFPLSIIVAE